MIARTRILHVVEALGGGVEAAIASYVATADEFEHGIVFSPRCDDRIGSDLLEGVTYAREVSHRPRGFLSGLRRALGEWHPHVVHAHSSLAGLYTRVSPTGPASIAYTPHGYAVERRDIGPAQRLVFRLAENVLALRTHAVGAVAPREAELARGLWGGRKRHVVVVPNVAHQSPAPRSSREEDRDDGESRHHRTVVGVGRVSPAKGTDFFRAAAAAARAEDPTLRWRWIGGGDPREEARMRAAGIEVTGWSSRSATLEQLAAADLYVHTAAWEGCPVALLEAVELGVPAIVRSIPALASLGCCPAVESADELAQVVLHADDGAIRAAMARGAARLRAGHTPQRQRDALRDLYRPLVPQGLA